jgi:hypothetical protein
MASNQYLIGLLLSIRPAIDSGRAGQSPERMFSPSDIGRREGGSRHLVEQRLDQVIIGPVDQRDIGCAPRQPMSRRGRRTRRR